MLDKNLVRSYFHNICQAVKYLHSHNYMHRDIKVYFFCNIEPENILITKSNEAKLCDFGFTILF